MSRAPDVANCRKTGYGNSPHTPNLGHMIKNLIFAKQTSYTK
jgi:hypothetical protein